MTDRLRQGLGIALAMGITATAAQASAAPFMFRNLKNEQSCLSVAGGNMTPGTHLILWLCKGSADQFWNVSAFSGNFYQLYDGAAPAPPDSQSRCAGLSGGSSNNGTQGVIAECTAATPDQGWQFIFRNWDANGHPCYLISSMENANRVLGPSNGVTSNGTSVILWDWLNHVDQLWCTY